MAKFLPPKLSKIVCFRCLEIKWKMRESYMSAANLTYMFDEERWEEGYAPCNPAVFPWNKDKLPQFITDPPPAWCERKLEHGVAMALEKSDG